MAVKKKTVCHQARHDCETNSPCKDYTNCADECVKNMHFDFKIERVSKNTYQYDLSVWFTASHKKYLSNQATHTSAGS